MSELDARDEREESFSWQRCALMSLHRDDAYTSTTDAAREEAECRLLGLIAFIEAHPVVVDILKDAGRMANPAEYSIGLSWASSWHLKRLSPDKEIDARAALNAVLDAYKEDTMVGEALRSGLHVSAVTQQWMARQRWRA